MRPLTLEEILACPSLPSLPAVAIQVLELTRDSDVRLTEIATVVQNDPALSAKILKTVNSSYYGLSKPCPTISRALAYLGLITVKSLVLGFSLVDMARQGEDQLDLTEYWRRTLCAAAAARRFAGKHERCDQEEAFLGGLMQDIGMLAINAVAGAEYAALIAETYGDHRRLPDLERDQLGFEHAEVGAELGERWRLAPELAEAIRRHHDGDSATSNVHLVRTVALGYEAATAINLPNPGAAVSKVNRLAENWFGFVTEEVKALMRAIAGDARELSALFNVNTVLPDINRVLAEAEEASVLHQITMRRETEDLRKTNDELARQATTDGLTKVGNRKHFDDELLNRFGQAVAFKGSVGMIIIDADHFKKLNDTYGHQVGDAVIELARRLGRAVRGMDVVCRYGGEEFAVILPGATLRDVATIAERLREAIAMRPFDMEGVPGGTHPVSVTVSLGVSVYDAETSSVLSTPERLVKAADQALYAAKHAGRNCARVFRTKSDHAAA